MYIFIQGCWLHFTGSMISSRAKVFSSGAEDGACDSFHSRLSFGVGWMLCVVASPLTILMVWPAITPRTCGLYLQPLCVSVTASVGTANVRVPSPSFTYTNTFSRCPSLMTTFSAVFVPLQLGSWLMSILAAFGAAPSNFTVPLTDAAVAGSIGVAAGAAGAVAADCSVV